MGGAAVYAIDSRSFRVVEVRLPAWEYRITFDAYGSVGGIVLPTRYATGGDPSAVSLIEDLEVDVALGSGRFALPKEIRLDLSTEGR